MITLSYLKLALIGAVLVVGSSVLSLTVHSMVVVPADTFNCGPVELVLPKTEGFDNSRRPNNSAAKEF